MLIEHAGGQTAFAVELAITPQEQARGLMFRRSLPADRGMLFVFDPPRPASFWMRNTLIPLDMLFIRDDGTVANIVHEAEPMTETPRRSDGPVRAVLEIVGGRARALGMEAGDRAVHPAFLAAPEAVRCPD